MALVTTQRANHSTKVITGIALGAIFLYSITNSLMSVLINEIVDGFSLSGASQGLMSSAFSLGSMVALIAAPLIQGRVSKLTVLLSAVAFQAVSLMLCGTAAVFPLFCVACSMLGMGGGLVDTYTNSILVDVHQEKSARYLGYLHGLFAVGSLLTPLMVWQALRSLTWRGAFFGVGGFLFLGTIILFTFCKRAGHTQAAQATQENVLRWRDLREYLLTPRNFAVLAAAVFATATQTGVLVWVLRYMTIRFDAETLGVASISLFWVCATINRFSISHIRLSPIRLLVAGAVLSAISLSIGVLTGTDWGMCIAMGGFGLSSGHFMQVLFSECAKGYAGKTTFVTSVLMVVMGITRSIVPLAMAYVSASLSVVASMLIPAVAALGVAVSGWFVARLSIPSQERIEHVL